MSLHSFNIRLLLIISLALLGVIILFLGFSRTIAPTFYPSANGPFSFGGDSLQDVFNRTLGVSTTEIYLLLLARAIPKTSDFYTVPEDFRHQSSISH